MTVHAPGKTPNADGPNADRVEAQVVNRPNAFTGVRVDDVDAAKITVTDTWFLSKGVKCAATLFLPGGWTNPPVVVMGHGFGATRAMGLQRYAERFAQRGLAVLTFDYRGWNDSDGTPRQYINPQWHNDDYDSAIAFARSLPNVNGDRIALWGSTFSGGHALATAARHPDIAAVVSQGPFVDGRLTALKLPIMHQIRALGHGLADRFCARFLGRRHNVRIAGEYGKGRGKFALIYTQQGFDLEVRLLGTEDPTEYEQMNFCPADIALTMINYSPLRTVRNITCPALVIGVEKDSFFWPAGGHMAAKRIKNATYIGYPIDHYDPYFAAAFEKIVVQMADFLVAHLTC
jgi:pimeloyl-ACP methyl ester carboxylesterase